MFIIHKTQSNSQAHHIQFCWNNLHPFWGRKRFPLGYDIILSPETIYTPFGDGNFLLFRIPLWFMPKQSTPLTGTETFRLGWLCCFRLGKQSTPLMGTETLALWITKPFSIKKQSTPLMGTETHNMPFRRWVWWRKQSTPLMGTETLFQEQLWAQLALIETIYTPFGDGNQERKQARF